MDKCLDGGRTEGGKSIRWWSKCVKMLRSGKSRWKVYGSLMYYFHNFSVCLKLFEDKDLNKKD